MAGEPTANDTPDMTTLSELFSGVANAIRAKKGTTAAIPAVEFPANINALPVLDTSDATATAANILSGKTAYAKGAKLTGTIAGKTASDLTASGATVTVPAGYYASQATKSVATATQATPSISVDAAGKITASAAQAAGYVSAGTKSATQQLTTQAAKTVTPSTSEQTAVAGGVYTTGAVKVAAMPTATQATPSISVDSAGKITASATQTAGYVAAGTKSATQQLTTQGAQTITPGTTAKTAVAAGRYTTGAVTVQGDSALVPGNIRRGASIFGVYGNVRPYNEDGSWGVFSLDVLDYEAVPLNSDRKSITVTLPDSAMKPFFIIGSAFDANNKKYNFACIKTTNMYFIVQKTDSREFQDCIISDSDDTYTIPVANTPISTSVGQIEFDFSVYYMYDQ